MSNRPGVSLPDSERLALERYALAAAASNEGLYDWDLRTDRVYYALSWKALLGFADDEVGTGPEEWLNRVDPDDLIWLQATLDAQASAGGKPFQIEYRMTHREGHVLWMMCRGIVVLDDEGEPIRIVGSQRDVTDRKNAEEQLRLSEERYALAAQGANDGLWDWQVATDRLYLSSRGTAILGMDAHARAGVATPRVATIEDWYAQVQADDRPRLRAAVETHLAGGSTHLEEEVRARHSSGAELWVLIRGVAIRDADGVAVRMAGSMSDITARKRAEQQLLFDAFHDGLTRLPNRMLLLDRIGQTLGRRRRPDEAQFAVMIFDIDHFKTVNDTLGPLAGDEVLCAVGQRLDSARRNGDTVARLGADEFGILMDGVPDMKTAVDVAERLAAAVALPLTLKSGQEMVVTVTAGIVLSGSGYSAAGDMVRDAGLAMYRAKSGGRNRVEMFDDALREHALARLRLENDLRHALEARQFHLFYQPIVRLSDGAVAGFEALMRWFHPDRGMIPPSDFVHLAEETGLILKMGRWALTEATRQLAEWQGRFSPDLFMSVNVSGRQLMEDDLVQAVAHTLATHRITPGTLKLEITESLLLDDPGHCLAIMQALKDQDVRLSLDDFGTGFSSLSYLHRYPIGTLKIDRSFVRATGEGDRRSAIARIITLLAQALDLEVIAEGIEKQAEADFLRNLHCHYGQGYYFAPPLPKEAVEELMDDRRRREALSAVSGMRVPLGRR
ncbi:MAG: EAL domain-containing protein [Azospirillaceae bacterium]|nr:EAL domain-containing protein [Azospirillaceae bacterium]